MALVGCVQRSNLRRTCYCGRRRGRPGRPSAHARVALLSGSSGGSECEASSDDKYSTPVATDEGVMVHQADPSTASSGPGLTWGSVLWPSGTCLARYLAWKFRRNDAKRCDRSPRIDGSTRILELGCGTGVVGLTCARLGARHVTLSDSESALWPILRKSIAANNIDADRISIRTLDWRDTTTFVDRKEDNYDLVVAADVLYAGMDGLFARTLASHLPSRDEIDGLEPPSAVVACPFRTDSPLLSFFGIARGLGLALDRLEDANGDASGAASGTDASEAFAESEFVPMGEGTDNAGECATRWESVAREPTFSAFNRDNIQIFRVSRVRGTSSEARSIRRVGRM